MKKIYILAALLVAFTFNSNAQFTDDFESYPNGPYYDADSGGHWDNWSNDPSATTEHIIVVGGITHSGVNSGFVGPGQLQDAVLDLGNKTTGTWYLSFWMYVPSNKEGYFNFQAVVPIGAGEWIVGNIHFNKDLGSPGVGIIDNTANGPVNFNFPHDAWFKIEANFDMTSGIGSSTWEFKVDGNSVVAAGTPFTDSTGVYPTSLGGIDFYSVSAADNEYYIDDIVYTNSLGAEDFSADAFSVYPNPVQDILNIKSASNVDNVTVYDILGKVVLQEQPGKASPSIDMSGLNSGVYLVKVTIGNASKTVKVLK